MRRSFEQSDDGGPGGVVEVRRASPADQLEVRAGPEVSERVHMVVKPLSGHGPS